MLITKSNLESILQPAIDAVKAFDWSNKRSYANWTAQTYYMVIHSTRLFAYCAARTPLDNNDFHNRFIAHMLEEKGHENLARTDLKALGYNFSDFPELTSTSAIYQVQYYWVNEVSPNAFFGYLFALEGIAAYAGKFVRMELNKHYTANSGKFVKVHSEDDVQHIGECFDWLAKMSAVEQGHVYKNLVNTVAHYAGFLSEISASTRALEKAS